MKSFGPLILIVAAVGIFFGFTDSQYKQVQSLRGDRVQYDSILDQVKELTRKREELRTQYNNFSQEEIGRLEKLIPSTVDNVRLILDIDNIASAYGIVIRNVNVLNEEVEEKGIQSRKVQGYGTISLSFSMMASYEDFQNFLRDLEDSLRLVDVRAVTVSGGDGELYNFAIKMDTYWLR